MIAPHMPKTRAEIAAESVELKAAEEAAFDKIRRKRDQLKRNQKSAYALVQLTLADLEAIALFYRLHV